MTQRVEFFSGNNEVSGALALPAGAKRAPGVILIHEYWGLNAQIQSVAERWAQEGFVALVPDLFHGKVAKTSEEAGGLMKALDTNRAVQEIDSAVSYLRMHARCNGKVAVSGYCMGGGLAFASACSVKDLSAVVPFYGLPGSALDFTKVDAPIQAHFAQHDEWATVDKAKKIQAAIGDKMELHVYDAQHAFCNDARPEVYNAEAAGQAWARAVEFVRLRTK
jgi:carboxymethylenebutenolidase